MTPSRVIRRLAITLLIVNAAILLCSAWALWSMSWAGLHVHGAYRDLDAREAIDRSIIAEVAGNVIAQDWALVVSDYLLGPAWDMAFLSVGAVSGAAVVSCIVCGWMVYAIIRHVNDK